MQGAFPLMKLAQRWIGSRRRGSRRRPGGPLERRRLSHICRAETLEDRRLLAWNVSDPDPASFTFSAQANGDQATLSLDSITGNLLLDGFDTGQSLANITGGITIDPATFSDTGFTIDNDTGDFLNAGTFQRLFNYTGGAGTLNSLGLVGESMIDDLFTLSNTIGADGTVTLSSATGNLTVNFTSLTGFLSLDALTGAPLAENDQLTVIGQPTDDVYQIDASSISGVGVTTNHAGFELILFNPDAGNDIVRIVGSAVDEDWLVDGFTSTVTGIGPTIAYSDQLEALELSSGGGNDLMTVLVPHTFPAPFQNLAPQLPSVVKFIGAFTGSTSVKIEGAEPGLVPGGLGDDTITVDVFQAGVGGAAFQLSAISCLHVDGHGGNDTILNNTNVSSILIGGNGNDSLQGGSSSDILLGGDGQDTVEGGDGNDFLFADLDETGRIFDVGNEDIDGGNGFDFAVVGNRPAAFPGDTNGVDNGSNNESEIPVVDPFFRTIHLFVVTPPLQLLEFAYTIPCAVEFFGPDPYLRGQFASLESFVARSFVQLLGREVDFSALVFWTGRMQGGLTVEQLQLALIGSPEYAARHSIQTTQLIRGLFVELLNRLPTSAELASNTTRLSQGMPRTQLAAELIGSAEGQAVLRDTIFQSVSDDAPPNPGDVTAFAADVAAGVPVAEATQRLADAEGDYFQYALASGTGQVGFVGGLYQDVLRRQGPVGLSEVTFWTDLIARGILTREGVANEFFRSAEFRANLIDDYYITYLGRGVDPPGLGFWLGAMAAGLTPEQVLAELASSPEYFQRNGNDADGFIRGLYRDVLRRTSPVSQAEVDYWIRQLAASPRGVIQARIDIILGLQATPEYRGFLVNDWFNLYLGRTPSQAELITFVNLLTQGASQVQVQSLIVLNR